MSRRPQQLVDAPLAIANDGAMLVNVHWCTDAETAEAALVVALASGRPVFVGVAVAVTDRLQRRLLGDLGDGVADSVGRFAVEILRPTGRGRRDRPARAAGGRR